MLSVQLGERSDHFEPVVAIVTRSALEECGPDRCLIHAVIDACAREAVFNVWDCEVKDFVPLLALRHVRCCIRAGTCDCGEC